jgi:hypothetical protein
MIGAGIETNRSSPMAKCPFCEKTVVLDRAQSDREMEICREVKGAVKKEVMYSCTHCDRVLGFGFFVGGVLTGRP